MKSALVLMTMTVAALPAAAQTRAPAAANQTNAGGTATVQSHMKSLGYKDIHDLRQAPDGQWIGKATQNGVEHTVIVQPNGTTTAR
jgi:hypothetical protein